MTWFPRTAEHAHAIIEAASAIDDAAPSALEECWPTEGRAGTVAVEVERLRALRKAFREARG